MSMQKHYLLDPDPDVPIEIRNFGLHLLGVSIDNASLQRVQLTSCNLVDINVPPKMILLFRGAEDEKDTVYGGDL